MSASASKRMPDLCYKAVNRYTSPPSCLPAQMDKRYYDEHSGGNCHTSLPSCLPAWMDKRYYDGYSGGNRLINPPVYNLTTYVNEGHTEYWHGAVIIPWKKVVWTPFCIIWYTFSTRVFLWCVKHPSGCYLFTSIITKENVGSCCWGNGYLWKR